MVYNIEGAIMKPISIYTCMKRYMPATIWFTFIEMFLYKLVKGIYWMLFSVFISIF